MMGNEVQTIHGYRIQWVTTETAAEIDQALGNGEIDGIGLNPFKGWDGEAGDFLGGGLQYSALALPYGDRIGLKQEHIEKQGKLKMFWISEFSGKLRIKGEHLRALRLHVKPGISVEPISDLEILYLRDSTEIVLKSFCVSSSNLRMLELNGGKIENLEGVQNLGRLRRCELSNLKRLNSVHDLSACKALEELIIESVKGLSDLSEVLSGLKSLRLLRLLDCGVLDDFNFLDDLELEEFRCSRTKVLNPDHPSLSRIKTVFVGK